MSPETLLKVDQEESSEQSLDYQVFEADEADDNVTNLAVTGDDVSDLHVHSIRL